jgi:hypothetical protein
MSRNERISLMQPFFVQITEYLEQRFYKDLRHENFTLAKVVPCIYRKLLCSCKENRYVLGSVLPWRIHNSSLLSCLSYHSWFRPLLATSSLSTIRTLLDQKAHDDLQVLGCLMLIDFLNGQVVHITCNNLHFLRDVAIYLT